MKVFRLNKLFDMKCSEKLDSSIVLIDKNYTILQTDIQQQIKICNPFIDLANKILLNTIFNDKFIEHPQNNNFQKIFFNEEYKI